MHLLFILLAGWGVGPSSSGPGTGGSGWVERPTTGWDSKAPVSGGGGQSGWDDGSSYKGNNNTSNTWNNNKDDR